ncbi:hypothetical protein AN642_00270 [Epulopiscium sp. SCG-B10WGA-EpuloA2]|nr:hypothetical protein AN642_00270 [Epulopiscium sp. SCG-B10WGA-EpuloA2]
MVPQQEKNLLKKLILLISAGFVGIKDYIFEHCCLTHDLKGNIETNNFLKQVMKKFMLREMLAVVKVALFGR